MRSRRKRKKWGWITAFLVALAAGLYFFGPGYLSLNQVKAAQGPFLSAQAQPLLREEAESVTEAEVSEAIQHNYEANFQNAFQAVSAYVVDASGQILYAHNEHQRLYPASTTKMMTAYLALTHTTDLDRLVTVGDLQGCYEEDSVILNLQPGDQMSMRDLLYALILYSYNDAAAAIALEVGGSLEGFAVMMNQQAQAIGATETHFVTPHGLHDEDHYTTAYDLNLILQMAYQTEGMQEIMLAPGRRISLLRDDEIIQYDLENASFYVRDLYEVPNMPYCGGKTGYTSKAGSCLASVFEKDGMLYYSTIMKSEDASYMTAILFDYYFAPEALMTFSKTEPLLHKNA